MAMWIQAVGCGSRRLGRGSDLALSPHQAITTVVCRPCEAIRRLHDAKHDEAGAILAEADATLTCGESSPMAFAGNRLDA
ncbi:hypothetical protein GUJ93_ZPchr0008g13334 [Zizania palustris]|uniref:Uncharacterized protein n=1 Tax=Zizania palustris TaxID=103762 RepID=A0A8J5VIA1_ZIZPA|nr:hypothetical protein GUJ93_ZPchr0008g13334 [Zizania palustris]